MTVFDRRQLKSFDADGLQFVWDATSIELASACLKKYEYVMLRNLRKSGTSVHLLFGGVYAKALERFYKLRAQGESIDSALRTVVRRALVDTYIYEPKDDAPSGIVGYEDMIPKGPVPFLDAKKTRLSLIRSIVWYVDQFGEESPDGIRTYIKRDGVPAVELSFTIELSDDILLAGHLDRAVRYGEGVYWLDNKTTGSVLGPWYFENFKPHTQFMGYTLAGKIILDSPVSGGIIDAAQIGVNFTRFERSVVTFTDDQLNEYRDASLHHIANAREATRRGHFPMNFSSCGNYGGCPFRTLCARAPSVRERFLAGDYEHPAQPWDPAEPR